MTRILLLGKNGQVGWELQRSLLPLGDVVALGRRELNLWNAERLRATVQQVHPDILVNAAAYTNVDLAESEEKFALLINSVAPGIMAREMRQSGGALIHFSTDFVFDGAKEDPYTEADIPNPINAYGRTKLAGEQRILESGCSHLILRTSWVYSLRRECFPVKVLRWGANQKTLRIVEDQVGSPTWCRVLAQAVAKLLKQGKDDLGGWMAAHSGLFHLANEGSASRLQWAKAILKSDPFPETRVVERIETARTQDFPSPAARPANSALNCDKFQATFGFGLPSWEMALAAAMSDYAVSYAGLEPS